MNDTPAEMQPYIAMQLCLLEISSPNWKMGRSEEKKGIFTYKQFAGNSCMQTTVVSGVYYISFVQYCKNAIEMSMTLLLHEGGLCT